MLLTNIFQSARFRAHYTRVMRSPLNMAGPTPTARFRDAGRAVGGLSVDTRRAIAALVRSRPLPALEAVNGFAGVVPSMQVRDVIEVVGRLAQTLRSTPRVPSPYAHHPLA